METLKNEHRRKQQDCDRRKQDYDRKQREADDLKKRYEESKAEVDNITRQIADQENRMRSNLSEMEAIKRNIKGVR